MVDRGEVWVTRKMLGKIINEGGSRRGISSFKLIPHPLSWVLPTLPICNLQKNFYGAAPLTQSHLRQD
jgi:hypothetical protein